jgi:hypothetical protein
MLQISTNPPAISVGGDNTSAGNAQSSSTP